MTGVSLHRNLTWSCQPSAVLAPSCSDILLALTSRIDSIRACPQSFTIPFGDPSLAVKKTVGDRETLLLEGPREILITESYPDGAFVRVQSDSRSMLVVRVRRATCRQWKEWCEARSTNSKGQSVGVGDNPVSLQRLNSVTTNCMRSKFSRRADLPAGYFIRSVWKNLD